MSDRGPVPVRLHTFDVDDRHSLWHSFVQPRLNSVQFCILRVVSKQFVSKKRNVRESRFEHYMRQRPDGQGDLCRFVLSEIETIEQCEILLGHTVYERRAPCAKLQKAAWKTKAVVVLKWMWMLQAPFFTYDRSCHLYYSRLMPKLAATGDRDLVAMCLPTEDVRVLAGFLSGPWTIEEKLQEMERTDAKMRYYRETSQRNSTLWVAAVESGCLDLMKHLHSTTPLTRVGALGRYSLATEFIPPTIEALDWLMANDMVCVESIDCMKNAAEYGDVSLLRHMQGLRKLKPFIFPLDSLALQQAIWLRHCECAKYLMDIGCPADEFCLDVAMKMGYVDLAEMLIARGVEIYPFAHLFSVSCLKVNHQALHLEMFEFLMRNGNRPTHNTLCSCISSGCAELAVYIHERGTDDEGTRLTEKMLNDWKFRSCAFNEYIDKHVKLDFEWGPA